MSTEMNQAVALVKDLDKQYRAVHAVADVLREIVDLEDYHKKTKVAAEKAVKEKEKLEAEKAVVEENVKILKSNENDLVKESKRKLKDAADFSTKIRHDASVASKKVVEDAKEQAEALVKDSRAEVSRLDRKIKDLNKQADQYAAKVDVYKHELNKLKERLG
jgi:chromosome segregation ATPase